MPSIDSHGLFLGADTLLAQHPNGYSCHILADHIRNGYGERAAEQGLYIVACGGVVTPEGQALIDRAAPLTPATMVRGGRYNWKGQPERLIYLRRFDGWHQFKKIGDPREVWCEVRDEDLASFEETVLNPEDRK